jgi:hypothetical protein
MKTMFCDPWKQQPKSSDKSNKTGVEESILDKTLRKDFLFFKLDELAETKTKEEAESVLIELNGGLPEGLDNADILRDLEVRAGATSIIHEVLNRDDEDDDHGCPSPLVAAPLLYKFASLDLGFRRVTRQSDGVVECQRDTSTHRTGIVNAATNSSAAASTSSAFPWETNTTGLAATTMGAIYGARDWIRPT